MKLSEAKPKTKGKIIKIYPHMGNHTSPQGHSCQECVLIRRLLDLGFIKGETIEVLEIDIFHSTFMVKIKGATYAICKNVASHIEIEVFQ